MPPKLVPGCLPHVFQLDVGIFLIKVSCLDFQLFAPLVLPSAPIASRSSSGMDYSYFPQTQGNDFYTLPQKPLPPYTPLPDFVNDPIVSSSYLQRRLQASPDMESQDSYTDSTAFAAFDDQTLQFQPNPFIHPSQPHSPAQSLHAPSLTQAQSTENSNDSPLDADGLEQASDEERELTPTQNRRKAQNRAACVLYLLSSSHFASTF